MDVFTSDAPARFSSLTFTFHISNEVSNPPYLKYDVGLQDYIWISTDPDEVLVIEYTSTELTPTSEETDKGEEEGGCRGGCRESGKALLSITSRGFYSELTRIASRNFNMI